MLRIVHRRSEVAAFLDGQLVVAGPHEHGNLFASACLVVSVVLSRVSLAIRQEAVRTDMDLVASIATLRAYTIDKAFPLPPAEFLDKDLFLGCLRRSNGCHLSR